MPAGKELDPETGLYYYGARYLDPKTSRWLSGDPAIAEYVPVAPVDDEAKKRNQNLPGMGGVFNHVNLHAYHYAGNNPVKYVDPDGEWVKYKAGTHEIYVKYENEVEVPDPSDSTSTKKIEGEMLSPGKTYRGKIDGVIVYNRETGEVTIKKVNDTKNNPFTVSLTVTQRKDGSYVIKMGWWSSLINLIGKIAKGSDGVSDGTYNLDDLPEGHDLRKSWYGNAVIQQDTVSEWDKERRQKMQEENEVQE